MPMYGNTNRDKIDEFISNYQNLNNIEYVGNNKFNVGGDIYKITLCFDNVNDVYTIAELKQLEKYENLVEYSYEIDYHQELIELEVESGIIRVDYNIDKIE